MDLVAWAKELQANLSAGVSTPGELLNALPAKQEEGPPAKVARIEQAPAESAPSADPDLSLAVVAPDAVASSGVADPDDNSEVKKAQWEQVFATFQQVGDTTKALDYAKELKNVRATVFSVFEKYKEKVAAEEALLAQEGTMPDKAFQQAKVLKKAAVTFVYQKYQESIAAEDGLLQKAYRDALETFQKLQENPAVPEPSPEELAQSIEVSAAYQQAYLLQVQAQQEVQEKENELRKSIDGAHQFASRTAGDFEQSQVEKGLPRPRRNLPQRPGMLPCSFYLKTGDCAYGSGCKWDHPDREGYPTSGGCFNCAGPHLARECPHPSTLPPHMRR